MVRLFHRASPGSAERPTAVRPLLAVDVDGVVVLLRHDEGDPRGVLVSYELIEGMIHAVSAEAGHHLRRLAEHYDLIWASGWERRASESLAPPLGLPRLPHLEFDGAARFGTAHWKLGPLERYARGRPLAWIDDSFDVSCFEWAAARSAPTLLVPVDPRRGLEREHTELLIGWASPTQ